MSGADPRRDPYEVLGVPREATHAQITAAYRALLRQLHPDTREQPADPARLADVLAAYAALRDPARRTAHDEQHPTAAQAGPVRVPVHVHTGQRRGRPDIWAGPVRRHRS